MEDAPNERAHLARHTLQSSRCLMRFAPRRSAKATAGALVPSASARNLTLRAAVEGDDGAATTYLHRDVPAWDAG
jgi:hypothetical protein